MKKLIHLLPLLFLFTSSQVTAQTATHSKEDMQDMMKEQEARVQKLAKEFFALNEAIEARMDEAVKELASWEDGKDTKTRVSHVKRKAIEDLKQSLFALKQQRAANVAASAQLPPEVLDGSLNERVTALLEEKMKSRLDQIMALATSLHQDKDVQKYEYYLKENYYADGYDVHRRRTDEYERERKQSSVANMDRSHLLKAIEKEERRIQQEINHVKAEHKSAGGGRLPPKLAEKIAFQEEVLEILADKKRETTEAKPPQQQEMGSTKEAIMLEQDFKNAIAGLRNANNQLRQKGIELREALSLLQAQKNAYAKSQKTSK